MKHQFVYAFEASDKVKIGLTHCVSTRMGAISKEFSCDLDCIGAMIGGREIQRALHRQFSAFSLGNEWFEKDEILKSALSDLFDRKGKIGEAAIASFSPKLTNNPVIENKDRAIVYSAKVIVEGLVDEIIQAEGISNSDAQHSTAKKLGVKPGTVWSLLYRPQKSISAADFMKILTRIDPDLVAQVEHLLEQVRAGKAGGK